MIKSKTIINPSIKTLNQFILSIVFVFSLSSISHSQTMHIEITRVYHELNCVLGELKIDDNFIGYTLELPYLYNFNDISSIPPGTYDASIRTDGKNGWRIQLENVPKRDLIQIHVGNYPKQITGCTLVGKNCDLSNCTVLNSKDALKEIESWFIIYNSDLKLGQTCALYPIKVTYK